MTHNDTIAAIPDFPHISAPMTLGEIVTEYNSHEYNAEILLQHMLLWVKRNYGASGVETASIPAADISRTCTVSAGSIHRTTQRSDRRRKTPDENRNA